MTTTIKKVEEGDLNARTHIKTGPDEIGRVALLLDELLDRLQERDRELRDWNAELNRRVDERTHELQLANRKIEATTKQLILSEKLAAIGSELERLGLPVLFLGSLFERPEVKDLLALLSVLTDRRAMGLVRIGCWPDFAMSLADVGAVLAHLREDRYRPGEWRERLGAIEGLSEPGRNALTRLAAMLPIGLLRAAARAFARPERRPRLPQTAAPQGFAASTRAPRHACRRCA